MIDKILKKKKKLAESRRFENEICSACHRPGWKRKGKRFVSFFFCSAKKNTAWLTLICHLSFDSLRTAQRCSSMGRTQKEPSMLSI